MANRRAADGGKPVGEDEALMVATEPDDAQIPQPEPQSPADVRDVAEATVGTRRMPDTIRRFLIRLQGGRYYLPAAYRLVWFRDELGDTWGIHTQLVEGGHEAGFATVKAEIVSPDGRVVASDYKTETKSDFPAGWVEKASTGAVARALALLGFGTQFMPELDDDGTHPADTPRTRPMPTRAAQAEEGRAAGSLVREGPEPPRARTAVEVWGGPGQCPRCHAPEGKPHSRQCVA